MFTLVNSGHVRKFRKSPTFGMSPDVQYWIGFTDEEVENEWVWTNGEPVTYTHWATGQPDGSSDYAFAGYGEDFWDDYVIQGSNFGAIVEIAP